MEFEYSKKTKMYMEQLTDFMNKHVYPNEQTFQDQLAGQSPRWQIPATTWPAASDQRTAPSGRIS